MANTIYFFKGDEKFLTNAKIDRLIKESKADELNISSYDCSEVNVEKAIVDASTAPFLCDKKVVIIRNPLFLETEKAGSLHNLEILKRYLLNPSEDTVLIINASGLKVNNKLEIVKAIEKVANIQNTNVISDVEFSGWLKRECEVEFVSIDSKAVALYYKACSNDLQMAKNEIDKAINYVGKNGLITEAIARMLIGQNGLTDVFALTNAIMEQDKTKAFKVYQELTRYEKDVSSLVGYTSKALRDFLLVKLLVEEGYNQASIAERMKVSPNRAYHMIKDVKDVSMDKLKKYIDLLAVLDYKIKSGKIDKKIGFEEFLLNI
ncbi:MAG: DNA polymerase III subunit delta [Bacilli bacterium]|nr:DNA polymerase III subunit delta [Bacilli bacterium]